MKVPAPWRDCNTPIEISELSPVRNEGRLMPSCFDNSRSGGSRSPGFKSSRLMSSYTRATTCSVVCPERTGGTIFNFDPELVITISAKRRTYNTNLDTGQVFCLRLRQNFIQCLLRPALRVERVCDCCLQVSCS